MEIEIFDKTKKFNKIEIARLKKFIELFADKAKIKGYLSVSFVNKLEIGKLNFKYRKIKKTTDVLSFSASNNKEGIFGDIIICPEIAKEKENSITDLIKHGVYHLMGYSHHSKEQKRKWNKIEKKYLYIN